MHPAKDQETGAWMFPESWPQPMRDQYAAAQAQLEVERITLAQAEASRAAAAASPETALLALRVEADAVRARTALEQLEAADDAAELALRAKYGARVRVVYTAAGRLILTWTDAHERLWDSVHARAKGLSQAALEASPPDPVKASTDALKAYREGYFEHIIVHPSKEQARKILTSYPDAWDDVFDARAALARGPREAAGKGAGR